MGHDRPRRVLANAFARLCYRSGGLRVVNFLVNRFEPRDGGFPFVRRRIHRNLQILTYHRVSDRPDSFLPAISVDAFRRQMNCLAERFEVLALDDAVEALAVGDIPENAVVITFDDGYRDNLEHALPVLSELGLTATVFLVTGFIGTHRMLWHDRVFRALRQTREARLRGFVPGYEVLSFASPEERERSEDRILTFLKSLEPEFRDERVAALERTLRIAEPSTIGPRLMLDWDEVRQMQRAGISFGSHTVTHPILSRLHRDDVVREIEDSKVTIERETGLPVTAFAYPNGKRGDFGPEIQEFVRAAGYRCALTTIFGANSPAKDGATADFTQLRRTAIEEDDPALFLSRMNAYKFAP